MMSTSIVVLLLGVAWCAYLATMWKGSRLSASARSDRIDAFSAGMGSLGGSASRSVQGTGLPRFELMPRSSVAAARRRRHISLGLGGLASLTLLASFALGATAIVAHVLLDLALGVYGVAALQRRNRAAEREIKVQMLYPEGVTPLYAPPQQVNA